MGSYVLVTHLTDLKDKSDAAVEDKDDKAASGSATANEELLPIRLAAFAADKRLYYLASTHLILTSKKILTTPLAMWKTYL
jgi:hypothetical protein